MPELPEVEVLVRHLAPLLPGRTIEAVEVRREKSIRPTTARVFRHRLRGARFVGLTRRAKYLVFELSPSAGGEPYRLLGHLGMTGRIYLQRDGETPPKHAAVVLHLDRQRLVFEDPRYFGRLTLDLRPLGRLGPEPFGSSFTTAYFEQALRRSRQPIKVRLLDQRLVAGVGNIYASEVLFRARISPRRAALHLHPEEVRRLRTAIRRVLSEAVRWGSTVPLDWSGSSRGDRLFYYGRDRAALAASVERLRVYDRAGLPCTRCRGPIRRIIQAGRSTYFCPACQHR